MSDATAAPARTMLNKVPQVTIAFWVGRGWTPGPPSVT